ncbi:alpha-1,2-fucosyltransferase [Paenibacillus sp. MMS20-IR301]|uniref:alpha-1,2-fucosyltransferase n=1 Tax=Paenibacillus sp. MMS20-IR301 TaxID=2895946 RepID=UPI0028EFE190|nr:alpha-1,2-fucosyltransferase [Paenibacillus sp. MMS20-IR301]WNS43528.1 alpha-1,2-fucosyltransferase [Paenibacillus sp. MMS20-IR301]
MIVVRVMGGLGNQMFQVAYARSLALEYGEDVYLDISAYDKYKIRNFSLSNLQVSDLVQYDEKILFSSPQRLFLRSTQKMYHIYQKITKTLTEIDRYGQFPFRLLTKYGLYYNFDRYYYASRPSKARLKCVYGYFQSEKYFKKYKQQISEELKVKNSVSPRERDILDAIIQENAIAVSLRLGDDYRNSTSLNVCDEDYFINAMDKIYKVHPDAVFYVFSDDIDRAKKFNFNYPVRFVEGFKDYESLRLMYSCKHFVISNSSFSWWGAYLAEHPDKMVIAPDRWYNDTRVKPDIYWDGLTLIKI